MEFKRNRESYALKNSKFYFFGPGNLVSHIANFKKLQCFIISINQRSFEKELMSSL